MHLLIFQQGLHIERGIVTVRLLATTLGPDGLLEPVNAIAQDVIDPTNPPALEPQEPPDGQQGLVVYDTMEECQEAIEATVNAYKERHPDHQPPKFSICPIP